MTGRTNYTEETATDDFDPIGTPNRVFQHFDPLVGESRSTKSSLPSSGNWRGRCILVEDINTLFVWTGTVWQLVSDYVAPLKMTYSPGGLSDYNADGWAGSYLTRVNGIVFAAGAFTLGSWGAGQSVFTIPAGYRPPHQFEVPGDPAKLVARANGQFLLKAAGTGGSSFTGSWPAAS